MKEINKVKTSIFIICIFLSFISCKTFPLVSFESEKYEQFKHSSKQLEDIPNEFYFSRIMTSVCVDIIFRKFSIENKFENISVHNLIIKDDKNNIIFQKDNVILKSNGINHYEKEICFQLYSYKITENELNRKELENYKTKYVILSFIIDGKEYSEKLKRVEKKHLLTRT